MVATLTEEGIVYVERALGIENLYAPEHFEMMPYLDNALRAHVLYRRDKDYIVRGDEVIIVDEFTGRLMEGRRYSEGLHQAIEAKEGVKVQKESMTLATITFQNYFRMYNKLSGMTGTAKTEEEEFQRIYDLEVIQVPTYRPVIRDDYGRPGLPHAGGQVQGRARRHRREARSRPARAGGHGRHRNQRTCQRAAQAPRHRARGAQRQEPRA